MIPYPDLSKFRPLQQQHIDWLLRSGITVEAMVRPWAILLARGHKANDGKFEECQDGQPWLVFSEQEDVVFWQPRSGAIATWNGRAFALGEEVISNPATYSFDCHLNIFANPLDWLRADRDGIVVLDWSRAFDHLRDAPRVAVDEYLLARLRRVLQPPHKPEIHVIRTSVRVVTTPAVPPKELDHAA